jgi:hypothetical protein
MYKLILPVEDMAVQSNISGMKLFIILVELSEDRKPFFFQNFINTGLDGLFALFIESLELMLEISILAC